MVFTQTYYRNQTGGIQHFNQADQLASVHQIAFAKCGVTIEDLVPFVMTYGNTQIVLIKRDEVNHPVKLLC